MPDVPDLNIQIQHSLRHAIGDFHSVSHGFKTAPGLPGQRRQAFTQFRHQDLWL
ncbi:hypothetical protein [Klebsiella pneumoniae]|nr:hypothetical protein [Klebsiella pneumoniae]